MEPINRQYIFSKEDALDMLLVALELLDLNPRNGNGRVELVYQDGILLNTTTTMRTQVKVKVTDILRKFFHLD
jgi:hypothetical protein